MPKNLICPIKWKPCSEENCAWWIEKIILETSKPHKDVTVHEHIGGCAMKAIASYR